MKITSRYCLAMIAFLLEFVLISVMTISSAKLKSIMMNLIN